MAPGISRPLAPNTPVEIISSPCTIETYLALKDPYCITPPGTLPLDLPPSPKTTTFSSATTAQLGSHLLSTFTSLLPPLLQILRTHQVSGNPQFRTVTTRQGLEAYQLLIESNDTDSTSWREAASQMQALFSLNGVDKEELHIELRNPALMYSDRSFALNVDRDRKALECINDVKDSVDESTFGLLGGCLTSVRWHSRGRIDGEVGERKPTLMLSVRPGSVAPFVEVEEVICRLLGEGRHSDVRLYVEILPGCVVDA